jgi:hypothetical protein
VFVDELLQWFQRRHPQVCYEGGLLALSKLIKNSGPDLFSTLPFGVILEQVQLLINQQTLIFQENRNIIMLSSSLTSGRFSSSSSPFSFGLFPVCPQPTVEELFSDPSSCPQVIPTVPQSTQSQSASMQAAQQSKSELPACEKNEDFENSEAINTEDDENYAFLNSKQIDEDDADYSDSESIQPEPMDYLVAPYLFTPEGGKSNKLTPPGLDSKRLSFHSELPAPPIPQSQNHYPKREDVQEREKHGLLSYFFEKCNFI